MSPALGLAHEMGHGAQHLDGLIEFNKCGNPKNSVWLEKNNIATWETPIAEELGEHTRKNYSDAYKYFRVNHSTDWGKLVPVVHKWWEFWKWGKKVFVNQKPGHILIGPR